MKRIALFIVCLLLVAGLGISAAAKDIRPGSDVDTDGDKVIAKDLRVSNKPFNISATFTLNQKGGKMFEGIGFYYLDGGESPKFSFYRFTIWREKNAPRLDFYLEKQYNDKNVGSVDCLVDGDTENLKHERFVSVDYDWNSIDDMSFKVEVSVDPATSKATARISGVQTGKSGKITVDLRDKARNEQTAGSLTNGKVFLSVNNTSYSDFKIEGYDDTASGGESTAPAPTSSTPPANSVPAGEKPADVSSESKAVSSEASPADTSVSAESTNSTDEDNASDGLVAISGVVVDKDGKPMPKTIVQFGTQRAKTDSDGRFTMGAVSLGRKSVSIQDENGKAITSKTIELVAGETASMDGITLTVNKNISLLITVGADNELEIAINPDGDPYAGDSGGFPVLTVVICAAAVLLIGGGAACFLLMKKKGKESPDEKES